MSNSRENAISNLTCKLCKHRLALLRGLAAFAAIEADMQSVLSGRTEGGAA